MNSAKIGDIAYYIPPDHLDNTALSQRFPEWSAQAIETKTGIRKRGVAKPEDCASDLAVNAAKQLFHQGNYRPEDIDFLLFCTQAPDYHLPTSACLLQDRLGLRTDCGALDYNLGCSGYVYGLALAKSLIESLNLKNILLITADTYSKYIHPSDKSLLTLFGDGAAATVITNTCSDNASIGPFVFGTDGRGKEHLIVPAGGARLPLSDETTKESVDAGGITRSLQHMRMNGGEIFNFTIQTIPETVEMVLKKSQLTLDQIDRFVFHQANEFMLTHLRKKLRIPDEKFIISMAETGNTVSSTIPIALKNSLEDGRLSANQRVMLLGFGVGYSWAGTIIQLG